MLEVFLKIDLWDINFIYLNYLGRCLESWVLPVGLEVVLGVGPLAVVPVPLGGPLICKLRIIIIIFENINLNYY